MLCASEKWKVIIVALSGCWGDVSFFHSLSLCSHKWSSREECRPTAERRRGVCGGAAGVCVCVERGGISAHKALLFNQALACSRPYAAPYCALLSLFSQLQRLTAWDFIRILACSWNLTVSQQVFPTRQCFNFLRQRYRTCADCRASRLQCHEWIPTPPPPPQVSSAFFPRLSSRPLISSLLSTVDRKYSARVASRDLLKALKRFLCCHHVTQVPFL